ncbi:copper radical oxidase, partial [Athelia psychrophila]
PSKGTPVVSPILANTLPAHLNPLTFHLPSGNLLTQSNWATVLLDYTAQEEQALQDILGTVRCYPASGGTATLPLTPTNNWTPTILFCGGSGAKSNGWETPGFNIPHGAVRCIQELREHHAGCVRQIGMSTGTAGCGNTTYTVDRSYDDNELLSPAIYNGSAPWESRWSTDGLSASIIPQMYHYNATLLPDG